MKVFQDIDTKKGVNESEKEVLAFWEREEIFKKSLKLREQSERYSFYDGPPFATGTPHYGHLVGSAMKDVVPRYWAMRGKYVERKWGWDCHGLPIENIVEKKMGSQSKKDIEVMGVGEFNANCRSNVLGYVDEWRRVISRFGRWADMDDAYRTMDPEYMESVWWVFKELWDKDLIYEGYRSMHICPRCETTLSQSEVSEGYEEVKDLSVTTKFKLDAGQDIGDFTIDENTYILAWTTTPWTLMGNVALAVGEDVKYQIVKITEGDSGKEEQYVIAKDRMIDVLGERKYEVLEEIRGKEFIGLSYEPLFDEYANNEKLENRKNGWKIYGADFVTTEEGTGVVHIAPAFGTDDMNLGKMEKLPFVQHIGMDGIFKSETGELADLDVKPRAKDKPEEVREADITMLKKLKDIGVYFSHEKYLHSYPHCWRCDTALLNYATSSWFVSVEKLKERALKTAKEIHWVPEHIKEGRFGKWLEGARDWSISRQRFWASVMPIWKCEKCTQMKVVGDVMDIAEELGGVNRLYLVRHGEAESNTKHFLDSKGNPENHLTKKGQEQVERVARELKDKNIDLIITSPLVRTRETADIIGKSLGVEIIEDDRIREIGCGSLDGMAEETLRGPYPHVMDQVGTELPEGVETADQLRKRVSVFLEEVNAKYRGKTILVVSHADSVLFLYGTAQGYSDEAFRRNWYPKNAEVRSIFSKPVDLHRPFIDEVQLTCECKGNMRRIPDVLDTWFDSGSMPYAQMHYPFENTRKFEEGFPGDFIAEGVDQTRAWFYYLHVLANGLKSSEAFKYVIVNGIVQAEDGKKMAKKLKNYPDPSLIMEKYGADVLRMYLLSSPVVMAENLNFSERELSEFSRGMFRMLRNTYAFFVLYANVDGFKPETYAMDESTPEGSRGKVSTVNLLDRWILSEFQVLVKNVNAAMESYELAKATRLFAPFVDNLSNWYVRRSRRRFWKSESDSDKQSAYETLHSVLVELAKLLAPFAPFIADEIYRNLSLVYSPKEESLDVPESVHLCDYPKVDESLIDETLNEHMSHARFIVSMGLQFRSEQKIKVRQPLQSVTARKIDKELQSIVMEELNVKEYIVKDVGDSVDLDLAITRDLKLEGQAREVIRAIQQMRKEVGYNVEDYIVLGYEGMEGVFDIFGENIIAQEILATEVHKGVLDIFDVKKEVEIDGEQIQVSLKKNV